jgi:response regulator of citrate/malate metabolism
MTTKLNIVLLADNSSVANNRFASMLEDTKNTKLILQSANCEEALKMMEKFRPDYILLDIALSQKAGMAVLEEIREKQSGAIVVITNLANKQYKDFCDHAGVNFFLDKPYEFELIPKNITGAKLN